MPSLTNFLIGNSFLLDVGSQMPTGAPMHAAAMNQQRMMGAQMGGMQMRGVAQGGPRMAPPNMRTTWQEPYFMYNRYNRWECIYLP